MNDAIGWIWLELLILSWTINKQCMDLLFWVVQRCQQVGVIAWQHCHSALTAFQSQQHRMGKGPLASPWIFSSLTLTENLLVPEAVWDILHTSSFHSPINPMSSELLTTISQMKKPSFVQVAELGFTPGCLTADAPSLNHRVIWLPNRNGVQPLSQWRLDPTVSGFFKQKLPVSQSKTITVHKCLLLCHLTST